MADRARLESVCTSKGYRGFESLPLRHYFCAPISGDDSPRTRAPQKGTEGSPSRQVGTRPRLDKPRRGIPPSPPFSCFPILRDIGPRGRVLDVQDGIRFRPLLLSGFMGFAHRQPGWEQSQPDRPSRLISTSEQLIVVILKPFHHFGFQLRGELD